MNIRFYKNISQFFYLYFQIKNLHVLLYMINECITFAQRMQICAYIHI